MPGVLPPPIPVDCLAGGEHGARRYPLLGITAACLPATTWLSWLWYDGADLSALNGYLGMFVAIALTVLTPLLWVVSMTLAVLSILRREGWYWIPALGLAIHAIVLRGLFE